MNPLSLAYQCWLLMRCEWRAKRGDAEMERLLNLYEQTMHECQQHIDQRLWLLRHHLEYSRPMAAKVSRETSSDLGEVEPGANADKLQQHK